MVEGQSFMTTTSKSIAGPVVMTDVSSDKPLLFTCGFYVGMIWSDTAGGAATNQKK